MSLKGSLIEEIVIDRDAALESVSRRGRADFCELTLQLPAGVDESRSYNLICGDALNMLYSQ